MTKLTQLFLCITFGISLQAQTPVVLGSAGSFAVLGGSTVTNTGPTIITGNVGLSPGSAVTGFPPGIVVGGTIHISDATAVAAQNALTAAYNDAAGRTPFTSVSGDLGGLTLTPGVYRSATTLGITGTVTLDALGNPNAVFIIQIGSALTTASASQVILQGNAQAANVFWQVGSSATLGTGSSFAGNILALTSITLTTGATMNGRALARNGAVTLDSNTIGVSASGGGLTPTPAPSTLILLLTGVLGIALYQSRMRLKQLFR